MADSNNSSNIIMGILMTICMGLSSFSLKWGFDANAELKVITVQMQTMNKSIEGLNKKSELDKKQDSQIQKFWKLHNWSRDEINNIRFEDGKAPVSWPELGTSTDWE